MPAGRPPLIDLAQVREMKAQGLGATEIAKALGIGRASVYRLLSEQVAVLANGGVDADQA